LVRPRSLEKFPKIKLAINLISAKIPIMENKIKKHCGMCGEEFEGAANKMYCNVKCRNKFNQWKWLDKLHKEQMAKNTVKV
jgi:hypothetical protein